MQSVRMRASVLFLASAGSFGVSGLIHSFCLSYLPPLFQSLSNSFHTHNFTPSIYAAENGGGEYTFS